MELDTGRDAGLPACLHAVSLVLCQEFQGSLVTAGASIAVRTHFRALPTCCLDEPARFLPALPSEVRCGRTKERVHFSRTLLPPDRWNC